MSSDRSKLHSVGLYFQLNLLIRMMDDATVWIAESGPIGIQINMPCTDSLCATQLAY